MNKEQSMHQKKMNLFLRVLFIILIIAISGAAILQIFTPEYMGRNSAYGISIGWQRKIRFWNIAVLFYRQPLVVGVIYNFFYVLYKSRMPYFFILCHNIPPD